MAAGSLEGVSAIEICNSCDAARVVEGSAAGYCAACECEALTFEEAVVFGATVYEVKSPESTLGIVWSSAPIGGWKTLAAGEGHETPMAAAAEALIRYRDGGTFNDKHEEFLG